MKNMANTAGDQSSRLWSSNFVRNLQPTWLASRPDQLIVVRVENLTSARNAAFVMNSFKVLAAKVFFSKSFQNKTKKVKKEEEETTNVYMQAMLLKDPRPATFCLAKHSVRRRPKPAPRAVNLVLTLSLSL